MTDVNTATVINTGDDEDHVLVLDASDSNRLKRLPLDSLYVAVPYNEGGNRGRVLVANGDVNAADSVAHTGAIIAGGQSTRRNDIGSTDHHTFGWYDAAAAWTNPRYTNGVGRHINGSGPNHNYIIGYDNLINGDSNQIHGHHSFMSADVDHSQIISPSWNHIIGTVEGVNLSYCWIGGGGSPGNGIGGYSSRSTILGGVNSGIFTSASQRVGSGIFSSTMSFIDAQEAVILGSRAAFAETGAYSAVVGGRGRFLETTLTALEPQGETVLAVAAITGVQVGDRIMVRYTNGNTVMGANNGLQHWSTVTAVSTGQITIANALPFSAVSGAQVKVIGGHGAKGAQSVVLGGLENVTESTASVVMGEDALSKNVNSFVIGTDQIVEKGDAQGFTFLERTTTTGNVASTDLRIRATEGTADRMNNYGDNVVVAGTIHIIAVVTANGSGGAPAAGAASSWKFPFQLTGFGTKGATTGWTGTATTGTVIEIANGATIANPPVLNTNNAAAMRVRVNSTASAGTSGTIRWIARIDAVMTHYT